MKKTKIAKYCQKPTFFSAVLGSHCHIIRVPNLLYMLSIDIVNREIAFIPQEEPEVSVHQHKGLQRWL